MNDWVAIALLVILLIGNAFLSQVNLPSCLPAEPK